MNHQTQREKASCDFSVVRRAGRQSCWNITLDRKVTIKNLNKFLDCLIGGVAILKFKVLYLCMGHMRQTGSYKPPFLLNCSQ